MLVASNRRILGDDGKVKVTRYTATADGSSMFIHPRSETEYLLIEYRARQLRDAALPDAGLAVWHIDELGSNAEPKLAAEGHRHYECRLLQADLRDDLEAGSGPGTEGDESDLFPAGAGPVFASANLPRWWSGHGTGAQLRDLREVVTLRTRLLTSARLAAVGELAAGIAHEINNPLAYINANLRALRDQWLTLAEASDEAKTETRRYAKRQLTWLSRNMIAWKWTDTQETEGNTAAIIDFIKSKA